MPVITVSRQFGSLGDEIARAVAERLSLRLIDQEIIHEVAQRLGVPPEVVSRRDERETTVAAEMLRTMRRLYPATVSPPASEGPDVDEAAYLAVVQQVIRGAAQADDVVIVGRAAALLLQRDSATLHVLVTAPFELRVERTMAADELDQRAASARVRQADASRERYIRHFYRTNWLDVSHYDLVVSTGHFGREAAVELVSRATGRVDNR